MPINNLSMYLYNIFFCSAAASVCKLDVPCPQFSQCNTSFISPAFVPASYYCKCDAGYEPSVKRPGNLILPREKCVKQKEPGEWPYTVHSCNVINFEFQNTIFSKVDPSLLLAPYYSFFFLKKKQGFFFHLLLLVLKHISGVHDFKAICLRYNINKAESLR